MTFDIYSREVFLHTDRLERMHRSALPLAIRGALNSAAFDVKKNTMPTKAQEDFTNRQKNFFKANSRVEMAKGFNTNAMQATVGFLEGGLKGGNNYAVKDLEQQEYGGTLEKKSFIPLNAARTGKSYTKNVRANARLSAINRIVDARKVAAPTSRSAFKKSVFIAGVGGFVLGKNILWRVASISKHKFKLDPLYSFKASRTVTVKKTGFMKEASLESNKSMEKWYIAEAKKQIARLS